MGLILNPHISVIDLLHKDHITLCTTKAKNVTAKIAIVNLMPKKSDTEYHLLRILGRSDQNIKVDFLYTKTYHSKNSNRSYLEKAYLSFDDIKSENYDGMIITGAPLEFLDCDDITYWNELKSIIDHSKKHIKSTIYLCWASLVGLLHNHNLSKNIITNKIVGVFNHRITDNSTKLFIGCKGAFNAPHSRYFDLNEESIKNIDALEILCKSKEAGLCLVSGNNGSEIYITGHPEYGRDTLKEEYVRDLEKGNMDSFPKNYFPEDNPENIPENTWEKDFQIFINNWIKYYLQYDKKKKV